MRCCPKCGSVTLMGRVGRLCCQTCKHVGIRKTFPHLHIGIDCSRDGEPVIHVPGGYQRTPTRLDGDA